MRPSILTSRYIGIYDIRIECRSFCLQVKHVSHVFLAQEGIYFQLFGAFHNWTFPGAQNQPAYSFFLLFLTQNLLRDRVLDPSSRSI